MSIIDITLYIIMPFDIIYGILNLNSVIGFYDYDAEISSKSATISTV